MEYTEINLGAFALQFTVLIGLLILLVPERLTLLPFFLGGIFLPLGLALVLGPLHLFMFRLLIAFGWLRLFGRHHKLGGFQTLDKLVLCFVISSVVTYTVLWQTVPALVNRLGLAFNAIGVYFFFRCVIKDLDQMARAVRTLVFIAGVIAVCALIEQTTTRNVFSVFGGVPTFSEIRDGKLRCQGPFAHSILAGTFGATMFPIFASLWWQPQGKLWAVTGTAASLVIVVTSSSSGPAVTCIAAVIGLLMWPLRAYMCSIRRGIALVLVGLHVSMNGPVWALISRASVFSSSSSDHRFELVDNFIHRIGEWWLLGTPSTASWGWGMQDVSNNYVRVGVDGGLISFIFFILIIVFGFKTVGRGLRVRKGDLKSQRFLWGLGVSLFSHLVAFMGVSYWDQTILIWYLLLAMIAPLAALLTAQNAGRPALPSRAPVLAWPPEAEEELPLWWSHQ